MAGADVRQLCASHELLWTEPTKLAAHTRMPMAAHPRLQAARLTVAVARGPGLSEWPCNPGLEPDRARNAVLTWGPQQIE